MTEVKYQIGDRIPYSPFIPCGVTTLSTGVDLYFLRVVNSDNTFVATEEEIERAIAIVHNKTNRLMRSRWN